MTVEERIRRTAALRQMTASDGWKIALEYISEKKAQSFESLTKMMERNPEKLTNRTAFAHGLRNRALTDFMDWLEDEVRLGDVEAEKILRQSEKSGPSRAGQS